MNEPKKEPLINKPLIDLKEMLERENKLLANKKFIDKLKDKGEKVRLFRDEIVKAIKTKESIEETQSFLARLSLGGKPILPRHPMFSVSGDEMRLAKQVINKEPKKDIIKEILNEEIDIYSIAISRTFDPELCQKRCDRFIPNRISNKSSDEKPKLLPLSIESSLEFGKDQKVKDYEVEKMRLENRLEWRSQEQFEEQFED